MKETWLAGAVLALLGIALVVDLAPAVSAHEGCPEMEEDPLFTLDDCVGHHWEAGEILTAGVYQSLLAKALASQDAYLRGDVPAAVNILEAFINEVEALSGVLIIGDAVHLSEHAEMAIEQIT